MRLLRRCFSADMFPEALSFYEEYFCNDAQCHAMADVQMGKDFAVLPTCCSTSMSPHNIMMGSPLSFSM
jgi:hypothetical protein